MAGIRDEHVFPTPIMLEAQPTLLGYYRLLLGIPQKTFYNAGSGMSQFRRMEERGTISPKQRAALPAFCQAMSQALAELVRQLSPTISLRDVAELPLLTLGSQFQGGNNNLIGQVATKGVFLALAEVVDPYIEEQTDTTLKLLTPDYRSFQIALASDPDVRVQEVLDDGGIDNSLSIEIKGGTDRSNVYNRGGEAEKSHQGAKQAGYHECWTVIGMKSIDIEKLKRGSPTTDVWYDTAQILAHRGTDWEDFQRRIRRIIGIEQPEA